MHAYASLLRHFALVFVKLTFPFFGCFRPRMPSTLDDFDVIGTIGSGSYGTCKKIRRKKDGKVKFHQ